jgi:hypothetical protein
MFSDDLDFKSRNKKSSRGMVSKPINNGDSILIKEVTSFLKKVPPLIRA